MKPFAFIVGLALVLAPHAAAQQSVAPAPQTASQRAQELQRGLGRGAEYTASVYPGEVLLPVYLLGAVGRPGIYNIPKKTELIRLLTLAGGIAQGAKQDDVTIKRRVNAEEKVVHVNLTDIVTSAKTASLYLEAGDVIYIPQTEPLISAETTTLLSFIATIISLVTSAYVLTTTFGR